MEGGRAGGIKLQITGEGFFREGGDLREGGGRRKG